MIEYDEDLEYNGYVFPSGEALGEFMCDIPTGWGPNPAHYGAVSVDEFKDDRDDFTYDRDTGKTYFPRYNEYKDCTLVHQTEKAYLIQDEKGQFWLPKSIIINVKIDSDKISFDCPRWATIKYIEPEIQDDEIPF
jgi:hypothetical protein